MKHYARNPRKITNSQMTRLEDTLARLGDLSGIVHDLNSDQIIGGNQRVTAMKLEGATPTILQSFDPPTPQGTVALGYLDWQGERFAYRAVRWKPEQCAEANIVANAAGGSWDWSVLKSDFDASLLAQAGLDADALAAVQEDSKALALLVAPEPAAVDDEGAAGELVDRAAELQKKWGVERGQLWEIPSKSAQGKAHRILCGDSTSADDVARVMQGEKAGLVATSPPYFNQREYSQWETYDDYLAFVAWVVGETSKHLSDDSIFAVNIGSDEPARRWMPSDWWTIIRDSNKNWLYRECIAWVKAAAVWNVPRSMHIENGHYFPAQRWEVILVVSRGKHPKFEMTDRDAVREFDENVWQIAVVSGNEQKAIGHNAPFPIEIPRRLIMAYTTKDKMVYEPFLGSGSTIAACEQTGRIGRGIEIEPKYVALERLSQLGLEPRRVESAA